MADNITLNAGSGGATMRTVNKTVNATSVETPVSQIDIGSGTSESLVTAANPLPVYAPGTIAVTGTFFQSTQNVSVTNTVPVTGTFYQATQPVSLATAPALVASTALIGLVSAGEQVNVLYNGTTALTPQYATISANISGDANVVVAASSGHKIVVLSYSGNVASAVTLKFRDYDGSSTYTDLTGPMSLVANQPIPGGSYCPVGLFSTQTSHNLTLNLSAGVQASGRITYVFV